MPSGIDPEARKKRRKDAVQSAVFSSAILLLSGVVLVLLRTVYRVEGFWGAVLLLFVVLDLGAIVPVWIVLKTRLKEIEGGEEDAAAQY